MKQNKKKNPSKQGLVIYKIRKENHMTQKQFADRIGTTQGTVSNWETGRTKVVVPYWWEAIKKHFGVDMERYL